jgi:hypothetical protein
MSKMTNLIARSVVIRGSELQGGGDEIERLILLEVVAVMHLGVGHEIVDLPRGGCPYVAVN